MREISLIRTCGSSDESRRRRPKWCAPRRSSMQLLYHDFLARPSLIIFERVAPSRSSVPSTKAAPTNQDTTAIKSGTAGRSGSGGGLPIPLLSLVYRASLSVLFPPKGGGRRVSDGALCKKLNAIVDCAIATWEKLAETNTPQVQSRFTVLTARMAPTRRSVQRYAHQSAEHLAASAERICAVREVGSSGVRLSYLDESSEDPLGLRGRPLGHAAS